MSDIAKAIKQISKTRDEVYSVVGEVTAVDEAARTCDVAPLNGDAAIFDVRLQSVLSGSNGVVAFPKVRSAVVVTFLNQKTGYVANTGEVDKIIITIGDKEMTLEADGFSFKSNSADFSVQIASWLDELIALIDTLLAFQVTTPSGPSTGATGTSLTNLAQHKTKFSSIKSLLDNLLK